MINQDIQFIKHRRLYDSRGWLENVNATDFFAWPETNFSHSFISYSVKNTLRGFHFQTEPLAQKKIVHVLDGLILDVSFCLRDRRKSPEKFTAVLGDGHEHDTVFLSDKMAHGFLVLSDRGATLLYLNSAEYSPEAAMSINPLDSSIGCQWGVSRDQLIISDRDLSGMTWSKYMRGAQ